MYERGENRARIRAGGSKKNRLPAHGPVAGGIAIGGATCTGPQSPSRCGTRAGKGKNHIRCNPTTVRGQREHTCSFSTERCGIKARGGSTGQKPDGSENVGKQRKRQTLNNEQKSYPGFSRVRITGSRMAAEKKDICRHPRDFAGKARTCVRQSMMAKGKPRHVSRSAPSLWVSRKSGATRPRIYDFRPGTRACVVKSISSRAIEDMWFPIYKFQGPTRKYDLQAAICEGERGHVSSNL